MNHEWEVSVGDTKKYRYTARIGHHISVPELMGLAQDTFPSATLTEVKLSVEYDDEYETVMFLSYESDEELDDHDSFEDLYTKQIEEKKEGRPN